MRTPFCTFFIQISSLLSCCGVDCKSIMIHFDLKGLAMINGTQLIASLGAEGNFNILSINHLLMPPFSFLKIIT